MNLRGIPGIVIVMQFTFAVTHWLTSSVCYLTVHCNSVCDVVNFTVLRDWIQIILVVAYGYFVPFFPCFPFLALYACVILWMLLYAVYNWMVLSSHNILFWTSILMGCSVLCEQVRWGSQLFTITHSVFRYANKILMPCYKRLLWCWWSPWRYFPSTQWSVILYCKMFRTSCLGSCFRFWFW